MNIIVDTNAYTKYLNGDKLILQLFSSTTRALFSTIVLGELEFGFQNGNRYEQNKRELAIFLAITNVEVVTVTHQTAILYGDIQSQLKKKGKPIPTNDVWIAAQAIEHQATLVTFDQHFKHIDNLQLWSTAN